MVDPTELGKQQSAKLKDESKKHYGAAYLSGLLGGVLGGLPFLVMYMAFSIKSWPFLILLGIGVYVLYLYFVDVNERSNKQLIFLGLADVSAVILILFAFVLLELHKTGSGITFKNISDAYLENRLNVGGVMNYTLFWHLIAVLFSAVGFFLVWLYLRFAVRRWERKHGKTEPGTTGLSEKQARTGKGAKGGRNRVSGMR